jgi:hypothetical protein
MATERATMRSNAEAENVVKTGDGWEDFFIPAASIFMVSILVASLRIPISKDETTEFVYPGPDERFILAGGISNHINTRVAQPVDHNDTENDLSTVMQW